MQVRDLLNALNSLEENIQEGDVFELEYGDFILETTVIGLKSDGPILAIDEVALAYIPLEEAKYLNSVYYQNKISTTNFFVNFDKALQFFSRYHIYKKSMGIFNFNFNFKKSKKCDKFIFASSMSVYGDKLKKKPFLRSVFSFKLLQEVLLNLHFIPIWSRSYQTFLIVNAKFFRFCVIKVDHFIVNTFFSYVKNT
jgi:hypothetical protein